MFWDCVVLMIKLIMYQIFISKSDKIIKPFNIFIFIFATELNIIISLTLLFVVRVIIIIYY